MKLLTRTGAEVIEFPEIAAVSPGLFGWRLRAMKALGVSVEQVSSAAAARSVRDEEAVRAARLGPQEGAIAQAQEFARELSARALRLVG